MGLEMRLHARHCGIEELLVLIILLSNHKEPYNDLELNTELDVSFHIIAHYY